jgi:hypothetical protein
MTVGASHNANYNVSTLTTQKYQPLADITLTEDGATYAKLITNRLDQLAQQALLPQPLEFVTSTDRRTVIAQEAGRLPPLVVISASRSQWIAKSLATAANMNVADFGNIGNLDALTQAPADAVPPVVYSPKRRGPNRNLYVVVHMSQYTPYRLAIAGPDVVVVGWQFHQSPGASQALTGFGASRYAAIEFCKLLKRQGAPWNFAWLLDDNVVALTKIADFRAAEAVAKPTVVAVGFKGATKIKTADGVRKIANEEQQRRRGRPAAALGPGDAGGGIMQQAVLWNIQYLDDTRMNFSPIYVTSAEDVSISYYLKSTGKTFLFYSDVEVIKTEIRQDDFRQNPLIEQRNKLTLMFVTQENTTAAKPPPPTRIDVKGVGGSRLATPVFIQQYFPKDPAPDDASSRVVEQIIAEAIKEHTIDKRVVEESFHAVQQSQWQ